MIIAAVDCVGGARSPSETVEPLRISGRHFQPFLDFDPRLRRAIYGTLGPLAVCDSAPGRNHLWAACRCIRCGGVLVQLDRNLARDEPVDDASATAGGFPRSGGMARADLDDGANLYESRSRAVAAPRSQSRIGYNPAVPMPAFPRSASKGFTE